MAEFQPNVKVKVSFELTLSEEEVQALVGITNYGLGPFKKVFYNNLGMVSLQPHEQGLAMLFETIKTKLLPKLEWIDRIRREAEAASVKNKGV